MSLQVHFDCRYKGIDAVSSRYARTLGGNRTIAEVWQQQEEQQQQLCCSIINHVAGCQLNSVRS
jgi:hypothetical protein